MSIAPKDASDGYFPIGTLLASQAGLPEAARDAIWNAGLVEEWKRGWPTPQQPSDDLYRRLAGQLTGDLAYALAASATDPRLLDWHVRTYPNADVIEAAAMNPFLDPSSVAFIQTVSSAADFVSDRVTAQQLLADHVAVGGTDASHVARSLIEALQGYVCADLLTSQRYGLANSEESAVADAIVESAILAGWESAPARLVRGAILELISLRIPEFWVDLGARIAVCPTAVLDAGALSAVTAAVDAGKVVADEVVAHFDTDAATWAEFHSTTSADLVPESVRPARVRRPSRRPDSYVSTKLQAEAYALIGLSSVGARAGLSSGEDLDEDELGSMLDDADIETFLDWAEGSLPHRPIEGEVLERISRMTPDQVAEISAEVDRRPDSLDSCGELTVCLPGVVARPVTRRAGRAIRTHLERRLAADSDGWTVTAGLIANRADMTLLEMADDGASAAGRP